MNKLSSAFAVLVFAAIAVVAGHAQPPASAPGGGDTYRVSQVFTIRGEGAWDYLTVDSEHGLLFVPRASHTMVIDAKSGKTVADILGQKHNHGVALVPAAGRGFISDGDDGSVVIFDLKSYAVLGKIKAADDADGIIYDPASNKVLVVSGDGGVLIPISPDVDPSTGTADTPVELGGKPEYLVADGRGKVYVNLEDKNLVAAVDTKTMKVVDRWTTGPGGSPVGLSMDRIGRRLFVGCRNPQKLIVMSAVDGKVLADLPIGPGVDATQFDGDAFASCRDGTLAVARETFPGQFKIVQTVKTRVGARTMGLDEATHTLYLPTAIFSPTGANGRSEAQPETFMIVGVSAAGE
jgi:hypothetical protein